MYIMLNPELFKHPTIINTFGNQCFGKLNYSISFFKHRYTVVEEILDPEFGLMLRVQHPIYEGTRKFLKEDCIEI